MNRTFLYYLLAVVAVFLLFRSLFAQPTRLDLSNQSKNGVRRLFSGDGITLVQSEPEGGEVQIFTRADVLRVKTIDTPEPTPGACDVTGIVILRGTFLYLCVPNLPPASALNYGHWVRFQGASNW
jgi:hypothetical protein